MIQNYDLSVIVIYYEKYEYQDISTLFQTYKLNLDNTNLKYEIIYVIDGNMPEEQNELTKLREDYDNIKIIKLGRWFGDATALQAGFEASSGNLILTLPSFEQVDATEISALISELEGNDMVICWRWPRIDSILNSIQSKFFNFLIKTFIGTNFHDLKCQVRLFKREILNNIYIYGDQDRFLPLWAWRLGYKINEVKVKQHQPDYRQKFYPIRNYIQRSLELISIFFLIKFTKKPIRFFGSSGLIIFTIGSVLGVFLLIQRIFWGLALADRPIVLVSILLIVFGILSFAIGLIGELIIFTHAKDIKDYVVENVYNYRKDIQEQNNKG